ncbi:putative transcription factor C3H family [Helianthus annuus]|nr:putative transcription factor C3H family [Helianthus annuus]
MNNQGNYQQYRARLPPPLSFQQAGVSPYVQPVPGSGAGSGTLTSSQSYMSWSQGQRMPPPVPPPNQLQIPRIPPPGQHFYRVPPPLAPPPSSSYFTPTGSGSFVLPPRPPPPPSSPPPGTPPLPPSSPILNGFGHVNGSEMSVKETSSYSLSDAPPPPPRDENTVRKIEVLCQYIAKIGEGFEEMTRKNEVGNPEFEFLFGGAAGSEAAISHEYFKWMKMKCRSDGLLEGGNNTGLSSKPLVAGTSHEDVSHSPAGSDMDMEDDITLPEEPGVGKSFGNEKHEAACISNDIDTKAENFACESPRAIEPGLDLSVSDTQLEKTMKVDVADSESSLDCKTEQNNVNLYQEMNQSEQSPFRLIQGYASDDNSENDNDPHFENVSPVAVTPQENERTTLSAPVVEGSLDIASKVLEPSMEPEKLENGTDGGTTGPKNSGAQKGDNNVELETDEFGRVARKGGSDSDSDSDDYSTRRRVKRGRSRSRSQSYERRRSRSPYGRRGRSPRRIREKRSPSRSWSPRKRGRSRSPYNRRNKSHVQEICYDFRAGKCYRPNCRYRHVPDKKEESRWRKNKHNHEVSDRLKDSDKSVPEKDEVGRFNEDLVEPPGHSADVASGHENEHPATEMPIGGPMTQIPVSGHLLNQTSQPEPQPVNEYSLMPPATLWNSFPPPPPPPQPLSRPQLGRPMPPYQLNPPPFQTNYPFQPFVTPYGSETTAHLGAYPMNYPILQQTVGPTVINQENFARNSSPNLVSSNTVQSFLQNPVADSVSDFARSRISSHYNPYASTFDQPLSTKLSSGVFNQGYGASTNQNHTPGEGQTGNFAHNPLTSGGDQYDPLFDSVDPSSNSVKKSNTIAASEENDGFGETADAEVGAVENDSPSPSSPIDLPDMATGEVEIDQVKNRKSKDSRSMKLFKIALADFVKEVLKPSWRQGNMSKEAFKTIVKKTVDKVSGAMKKHQIPKSQAKINHYIDSSQRKLTKLVMGYVDKYVKV